MYLIFIIHFSCVPFIADASLINFVSMGKCILGYNPAWFLLRHGCYCGFGNHGNVTPEDGYDEYVVMLQYKEEIQYSKFSCCRKKHDDCYDKLVKEGACSGTLGQYLLNYWFECSECQAKCYLPFPFKYIGWYKRCAFGLCKCDRKMMKCWRRKQWLYKKGAPPDKRTCSKATNALTPRNKVSKERSWWEKQIERLLYPNRKEMNEEITNRIDESEMDKPGSKCRKYARRKIAKANGADTNEIY